MVTIATGLNHLELKPAGYYKSLGMVFDIYIDGKCFLAKVTEFERRFDERINGAYTSALGCRDIIENMANITQDPVRFMPYACDCGEWECWVFQGFITSYDGFVFWGQWRNPNRSDKARKGDGLFWDYKEFPTLCFDRAQYLNEITKAQALVKADKLSQRILGLRY